MREIRTKRHTGPLGAGNRRVPPWASTIERHIESPVSRSLDLVVKKASNSRSACSVEIPAPQSLNLRILAVSCPGLIGSPVRAVRP
jgi:hypothetical protein